MSKSTNVAQTLFIAGMIVGSIAYGGSNTSLNYQGNIIRPDGSAMNSGSAAFTLKIYDATKNCVLYSETQTIVMTDSLGVVSIVIGAGTRTDGGAHTFKQVFVNAGTLTGLTCGAGTTYSPTASDDRNLVVSFVDAGTTVALPSMAIKSVPYAMQADQVSGYGIMNLAKISGGGSASSITGTQFDFLANLAAPASSSATPCIANDVLKFVGGVWTCAAAGAGSASTSGLTAATGINSIDNANFAQTWDWSTATTQIPMSMTSNMLTTGSTLRVSTSSASLNSTNGVLSVANTGASITGILARFQSNSTAGSGLTILANGNVGIGTATPVSRLEVNGTVTSTVNVVAAAAVDLSKSNTHTLATVGGSTITLSNMADGGVYNIVVEDTTVRTYAFAGCTNTYWKPAAGPTTAASRTVFGILAANKAGLFDCYVTWSTGFQ